MWTGDYFTHSCSKAYVTVLRRWKTKRQKSLDKYCHTISQTNDCVIRAQCIGYPQCKKLTWTSKEETKHIFRSIAHSLIGLVRMKTITKGTSSHGNSSHIYEQPAGQPASLTERHTDRHTANQLDRQTDRQTNGQTHEFEVSSTCCYLQSPLGLLQLKS